MQLFTNNTRENITTPIAIAKQWLNFPTDVVVHPFNGLPTFKVVNLGKNTPYDRNKGGVFLKLAEMKKAGAKLPEYKTGKFVDEDGFEDNIVVSSATMPAVRVTREKAVLPEYGYCMLTNKLEQVKKLKWRRIYNRKVYSIEPRTLGYVWLQDKQQWIKKNDARATLHSFTGESVKYFTDRDWLALNHRVDVSPIEGGILISREESVPVRLADGGTTRISRYERAAEEHNTYFQCHSCSQDCVHEIRVSDTLCSHCAASATGEVSGEGRILNYSHRVERDLGFDEADCLRIGQVKGNPKMMGEPVFLGAELEFLVNQNHQQETLNFIHKSRYAQAKSDSSIGAGSGSGGYEIVTKPCGLATHRKNLLALFSTYANRLSPHSTCGMHVHVSRVFNDGEIGKIVYFLNREANRDFVTGLARRENNVYSRYSDKAVSETILAKNNAQDSRGRRIVPMNNNIKLMSSDRRTALNVKESTMEFRIFASSNDFETVMATLQFCEALCMYAHEVKSLTLNEWSNVKNFVDYLNRVKYTIKTEAGKPTEKAYRYQELLNYIERNKLSTVSKDMHEIKVGKIIQSFMTRVNPTPRHMELPARVRQDLANQLAKSGVLMPKWLDNSSNIVTWHNDAWCLLDYKGNVLLRHATEELAA